MTTLLTNYFNNLKNAFIPNADSMPQRRYDLDWLRVLVFALLILYHIGMLYVENWGYLIKSQYLSQSLENIMLLSDPWRMASLWIISGISIRFILVKVSLWKFVSMRSVRLLLPLFFGILVIVPPQLYYQMTFEGNLNMGYWQFYQVFFQGTSEIFKDYQPGIWPHIDVNHLWYLRELWLYSLFLIPLLPILNSRIIQKSTDWLFSQRALIAITIAVLPIFIIQLLDGDDTRNKLGFTFLLYGYLIGWQATFWQRLRENTRPLLILSLVFYIYP